MSVRETVLDVLQGRESKQIPFLCRLDSWLRGRQHQNAVPPQYHGLELHEIHATLGVGHLDWLSPVTHRYRQVELIMQRDGETIRHEHEPQISYFPDLWGLVPVDQPGTVTTELITPVGKLICEHRITEETRRSGTNRPEMVTHPLRSPADGRVYEFILEKAELIPQFKEFCVAEAGLGENGYLVPLLNRTPLQSLLTDAFGETAGLMALRRAPDQIQRLMDLIDARLVEALSALSELLVPYVEFRENLDAATTSPDLFRQYAVPYYQRYSDILHRQGKLLGAHTDGNLKPLLGKLPESGLDVCESFAPAPLSDCTFEEAWEAWSHGPLIWGGIPSTYLEPRTPESELHAYVEALLQRIGDKPIILSIADGVMSDNDIERLRWIAQRLVTQ